MVIPIIFSNNRYFTGPNTIIDWTNDEVNFSTSTPQYRQPSSLKNMAVKSYSSKSVYITDSASEQYDDRGRS
ncbi:855_t:CDS:2 [Funneliformis mosseae]|uniref:855_t:CDS:1 n=1 Tax=Funneliformis mosseae TaxID=27381 RepID=A0A9N9HD88_FUNMO|nr:855_t:CDS:2 [Funneliformis mosseae]